MELDPDFWWGGVFVCHIGTIVLQDLQEVELAIFGTIWDELGDDMLRMVFLERIRFSRYRCQPWRVSGCADQVSRKATMALYSDPRISMTFNT